MGLHFCLQKVVDNKVITEDLIKNGRQINVTSNNIDLYIEKR